MLREVAADCHHSSQLMILGISYDSDVLNIVWSNGRRRGATVTQPAVVQRPLACMQHEIRPLLLTTPGLLHLNNMSLFGCTGNFLHCTVTLSRQETDVKSIQGFLTFSDVLRDVYDAVENHTFCQITQEVTKKSVNLQYKRIKYQHVLQPAQPQRMFVCSTY